MNEEISTTPSWLAIFVSTNLKFELDHREGGEQSLKINYIKQRQLRVSLIVTAYSLNDNIPI